MLNFTKKQLKEYNKMFNYTKEQIKEYIIKNYPDSCLAANESNKNENSTFINIRLLGFPSDDECEDFFYSEKLEWCGCGNPEIAKRAIRDYLRVIAVSRDYYDREQLFKEKFGSDNPLLLCLAYTLDAAGFTKHGSSIDYCWLTEEGKMFLWLLDRNKSLENLGEED